MFRFTIRDVLWLTVVVALVAGWTVDHRNLTAKYDRMEFIANVVFDHLVDARGPDVQIIMPDGSTFP